MTEQVIVSGISGLDSPELKIGKHEKGRRDRQRQRKLSYHFRRPELGQYYQHAPLTAGINDVTGKGPKEIDPKR